MRSRPVPRLCWCDHPTESLRWRFTIPSGPEVIAEVDEALCRALARVLPKGTVVRLDPPKPTWQTEKPSEAIDLFLYGIAQDAQRTESGWDEERDGRGVVISRAERPRRFVLTYLVTARAPKIA